MLNKVFFCFCGSPRRTPLKEEKQITNERGRGPTIEEKLTRIWQLQKDKKEKQREVRN